MNYIDDLIWDLLDLDLIKEDNKVEFTDEAKKLIHEISQESMHSAIIVKTKNRIDDYGKNMSAEDVYIDMLHKIAYAPTTIHVRTTARLLISVIDQKLKERSK